MAASIEEKAMTLVESIYSIFVDYQIYILSFLCVVIALHMWGQKKAPNVKCHDEKSKFTACDSPDCVRCQKYHVIRENAPVKLDQYASLHGWDKLDRLRQTLNNQDQEENLTDTPQQPNVLNVPGLTATPWWSTLAYFDELSLLEEAYDIIKKEFCSVLESNEGWSINSTPEGQWSVFHFYNQGSKVEDNAKRCPRTCKFLECLPSFMKGNLFGNAGFSVLYPQTKISEHYGPCNVRIRCHLGLFVNEKCGLTVDGKRESWQEGRCIVFDDSFLHEAINGDEQEARAVLLFDLWHSDVTKEERRALNFVFSS